MCASVYRPRLYLRVHRWWVHAAPVIISSLSFVSLAADIQSTKLPHARHGKSEWRCRIHPEWSPMPVPFSLTSPGWLGFPLSTLGPFRGVKVLLTY